MLKILHGSDFHFGKPHLTLVNQAFGRVLETVDPDVVVLSGDFTQRAKDIEYQQVRTFLDSLNDVPVIVTPGNHDIPLYRIGQRLLNPYKNYQKYVSRNLDEVTRLDGAIFVALNSADPNLSIINGRITRDQVDFATRAFRESRPKDLRILVTHHPLVHSPDEGKYNLLPESDFLLESFADMGVELILSGHVHRAFTKYVTIPRDELGVKRGILVVHSGTTTSNRGRVHEKRRNTLNVVDMTGMDVKVSTYWYEEREREFLGQEPNVFRRGV